jgi:integrase/recombinase XerC
MRLRDALAMYLRQMEADGRSDLTLDQNGRYVGWLDRWLATERRSRDMRRIDHETLAAFLTSPMVRQRADGTPKKQTTQNTLRSSLRSFFAYVHAAGFAPRNAAALVRRARCSSPPPHALSKAECRRLVTALAQGTGAVAARDRMLINLLLGTGARITSALAVSSEDLDLARGELRLRVTKNSAPATVYLSRSLRRNLRSYLRGRPPGLLFPGKDGRPLGRRTAQRRLAVWLQRAGLRHASPHALRHAYAVELLQRTGDILLVQAALRHKSLASTLTYARADEGRLRRALSA